MLMKNRILFIGESARANSCSRLLVIAPILMKPDNNNRGQEVASLSLSLQFNVLFIAPLARKSADL